MDVITSLELLIIVVCATGLGRAKAGDEVPAPTPTEEIIDSRIKSIRDSLVLRTVKRFTKRFTTQDPNHY